MGVTGVAKTKTAVTENRLPKTKTVVTENRIQRQFRDIKSELKKVTWPSRQEAINLSTIVIAVAIAVGLFLGGIDYIFSLLVRFLVGG
jgi:preprotein translocase subunit SecE